MGSIPSTASATEAQQRRADHLAVVGAVLDAVNSQQAAKASSHLAQSVSYEAPYYDLVVTGRQRLVDMFSNLGHRFATLDYRITAVHDALDPDQLILELRGDHAVVDSPKRYQNHYVMFITFAGEEIVRWVEFSNPKVYEAATS